jgi:hypothetical protein
MYVLACQLREQFCVQECADAFAGQTRFAGNTHFYCGLVGFFAAKRPRGGISGQTEAGLFGDENPVPTPVRMLVKPFLPLLRSERSNVEGDVGVVNLIVVQFSERRQVGQGCGAYDHSCGSSAVA